MTEPDDVALNAASDLLVALGNFRRLSLLMLLTEKEVSVGELARAVGLSQSALSQHLAKLRAKDLVITRRDAQTVYYSCQSVAVKSLLATIYVLIDRGQIRVSNKFPLNVA